MKLYEMSSELLRNLKVYIRQRAEKSPFRHLLPYIKKHRIAIVLGVVCLIVTDAFGLVVPLLVKEAIDSLSHSSSATIWTYPGYIVMAVTVRAFFRYLWRHYLFGAARTLEYELRNDFFQQLLNLPVRFFQKIRSGDIMSRAISDLSAVRQFVTMGLLGMVDGILLSTATLSLMVVVSPRLTVLSVVPMLMVTYFVTKLGPQIRKGFKEVQEGLGAISSHTQENITGIKVVQAYVQEERQVERFEVLAKDYLEKNISLARITARFEPLLSLVVGLCAIMVLIVGGREIMLDRLTLGGLAAFMAYLAMLAWPMTALGILVNQYQRGRAAMLRLQEIFDVPRENSHSTADLSPEPHNNSVEFRGLTFSYNGQKILQEISGTIPDGRWVAIIGRTGCGKSTLVNLLPRLFNPPHGMVFVGRRDVRQMDLTSLRARIGFVSQDVFLFSESIAENIRMGRPEAVDEVIEKAIIDSVFAGDVAKFPSGRETLVGERGITLSGGQRQRSEIARAILRDPGILVLDDAFSNVDTEIENRILTRLREIRRNKTTLIISHRISTAKVADEIWTMEQGRIVDRGSPEELLRRASFYADLTKKQELL